MDLIYRYDHTFGLPAAGKGKSSSAAHSLVNWLLASPAPLAGERRFPEIARARGQAHRRPKEEISAAPAKLTSADRQRIQEWVQKQLPNLQSQLPYLTDKFWNLLKRSIGGFLGVTGFLLSLVMVPIYFFFLLKERPAIERRWREYLPFRNSPLKDEVAAVLSQINSYVIAYFRGQLLVCLIDGMLIGTALLLLGLNFAPLIGLLVVILTMIPYLGIVLCWVPAVLIAAAQWGDWTHPLIVTLVFFGHAKSRSDFHCPTHRRKFRRPASDDGHRFDFRLGFAHRRTARSDSGRPSHRDAQGPARALCLGPPSAREGGEQIEEVPVVQAAKDEAIA